MNEQFREDRGVVEAILAQLGDTSRFAELEADAVRQWETIEQHRRSLVLGTFGV